MDDFGVPLTMMLEHLPTKLGHKYGVHDPVNFPAPWERLGIILQHFMETVLGLHLKTLGVIPRQPTENEFSWRNEPLKNSCRL